MKLTPQQKINVLENIDWPRMQNNKHGLCYAIRVSFRDLIAREVITVSISPGEVKLLSANDIIDLLTFYNARRFARVPLNSIEGYWFSFSNNGYAIRKIFRDWMINQYQKQLENGTNY